MSSGASLNPPTGACCPHHLLTPLGQSLRDLLPFGETELWQAKASGAPFQNKARLLPGEGKQAHRGLRP